MSLQDLDNVVVFAIVTTILVLGLIHLGQWGTTSIGWSAGQRFFLVRGS